MKPIHGLSLVVALCAVPVMADPMPGNPAPRAADTRSADNSIFVEGYLTTPGQAYDAAQQMVRDMGFEVEATA